MIDDVLESAIHDLIYNPHAYWPDDTYFHRRNRQKLARSWATLAPLHGLSPSTVVDQFVDILQRRREQQVPTLYAMSNGGSGCHFLGQLLDELPGLRLTDEVYFPPRLLRDIAASEDERDLLAIDFVNFFHAGTVEPEDHDLRIVNIGHLHPDTPPAHLAKLDRHGQFILLIRNPYDIAVSRAFRKEAYRAQVAPEMSDDEYLQRQVDGTKAFLTRARAFQWHNVVRYEDLTSVPTAAVAPLVRGLGLPFDEEQFEAARRRLEGSGTSPDARAAGNLNTRPQEPLTRTQIGILHDGLAELAAEFGYEESRLMARSRENLKAWTPQYLKSFHYDEERFRRLDAGFLKTSNYLPEVELAPDPDWTADPFGNKTWRLVYHSLGWLLAYAWGVHHGPDPETARRRIADTVTRYLSANVFSPAADHFAWNDHATSDRLAILAHLWLGYLSVPEPLLDEDQFVAACEQHVDKLVAFYESKTWLESNHGLLHALALLSFASVFPTSRSADKARTVGSAYLKTVVSNLVAVDEGVALEQSLSYHQFDLRLLRTTRNFLVDNYPDLALVLEGVTDRMVDFNLCVRISPDVMPAVGDTHLNAKLFTESLTPRIGEGVPKHLEYIESRGERGTPFPPLVVYPRSGYSVFRRGEIFDRDGEGDGEGNHDVTRGIFLHQPERVAHGHFDALSLILTVDGRHILVDSGGPYTYGSDLRFSYFMASRAHNVLLIDDQDHRAGSRLVGHGEVLDCQWVTAEHSGYEGRTVSRTVVGVADGGFVVLDSATAGSTESSFDLLWHFSPESQVATTTDGRRTTTSIQIGEDRFTAHALMSADPTVEIVEGRLEPTPQGWVTEAPETKRAAPVLVASARGTGLLAVTAFVRDGTQVVTRLAGDSASVQLSGYKISFKPGRPPRITRARRWSRRTR